MASPTGIDMAGRNMALTDTENLPARAPTFRPPSPLRAWLSSERGAAQRMAGAAFVIRVAGAVVIFLCRKVILPGPLDGRRRIRRLMCTPGPGCRWSATSSISTCYRSAPRSAPVPEYTCARIYDSLRGFLLGSRWMVFTAATIVAVIGAVMVQTFAGSLQRDTVLPLYLACTALPFYSLSNMLDATARSYNAVVTAFLPPFVLRPLILIVSVASMRALGLTPDASSGMAAFAFATWTTTLLQMLLVHRCLHRLVPAGPRRYHFAAWLKMSGPMFAVWGFYMLLTYTDVLVLRQFQPPEVVAHYYAAAKTLALVTFIHSASVSAAVAHRFAAHHVAGDRRQPGGARTPAHRALDVLAVAPGHRRRSGARQANPLAVRDQASAGFPAIRWMFDPGDPAGRTGGCRARRTRAHQHAGRAAPLRAGLWRDVRAQPRRLDCGRRSLRRHGRRLRDRGGRRDRSGAAVRPDCQTPGSACPAYGSWRFDRGKLRTPAAAISPASDRALRTIWPQPSGSA